MAKQQQITCYTALAGFYAAIAAACSFAPAAVVVKVFETEATPLLTGLVGIFSSYQWAAALALWCLRDAAVHERLGSDTYKRLNLVRCIGAVVMAVADRWCRESLRHVHGRLATAEKQRYGRG